MLTQQPNNMITKTAQVKGTKNKTNEANVKLGPKIRKKNITLHLIAFMSDVKGKKLKGYYNQ